MSPAEREVAAATPSPWPRRWPASARDVATGIERMSDAMRAQDRDAIADAVSDLLSDRTIRVEDVYAAMLRTLLEAAHPDGLDGDDIGAVVRDAATGDSGSAPSDIVTVVLGTLGVHPEPERTVPGDESQDPDDHLESRNSVVERMEPAAAVRASAAVVEALVARIGTPVGPVITMVVDDIAAAELIEWP